MEAMGLVQWPTKVPEPSWYTQKIALAQAAYRARFGPNFHAVYPLDCLKSILPHSKVMVLIYPTFLRFVVTSANYMEQNFSGSDNVSHKLSSFS